MEIQQLKGFISVAKYKGFSRAAEKTFRTQPAVSLQIKALERELGVQLFDRLGARRIELTEDGKILFQLAAPLLEDLESLKSKFDEARGQEGKSSIRIATHTSVMTHLLPEAIRAFKKKYPECDLSIVNRGKKEILAMVMDGEADIGICSLSNVPPSVDYKVFARFNRLLITGKGHPLAKKAQVTPKDIAQYPIIVPPQGSNSRKTIDEVFGQNELDLNIAMEVTGREAVKTYVETGLGISIINEYYLTKEDQKKLFCRDVSRYFGRAERGILTRKGKYLSKPCRELIKSLHTP